MIKNYFLLLFSLFGTGQKNLRYTDFIKSTVNDTHNISNETIEDQIQILSGAQSVLYTVILETVNKPADKQIRLAAIKEHQKMSEQIKSLSKQQNQNDQQEYQLNQLDKRDKLVSRIKQFRDPKPLFSQRTILGICGLGLIGCVSYWLYSKKDYSRPLLNGYLKRN